MRSRLLIAVGVSTIIAGCDVGQRDSLSNMASRNTTTDAATVTEQDTQMETGPAEDPNTAERMRELRKKLLTTHPDEFRIQPSDDSPLVYGALCEFPAGQETVTVVSLFDGTASLYSTSGFGVIGGQDQEPVRSAAKAFVKTANTFHDDAISTDDFPYPKPNRVRLYLLTFSGARCIDTDLASMEVPTSRYFKMSESANNVLNEIRSVLEH